MWILISSQISSLASRVYFFRYQIFDKLYINVILTALMKYTKASEQALDFDENISEVKN